MISPQKENGYTPIANEIMDALAKIRIPGQARQVLDFILRKTYGWNKKQAIISLSQFVEGTGLSKVSICKGLNKLLEMKIITKLGNAKSYFTKLGNDFDVTYGFQKQYKLWLTLPKKVTSQKSKNTLPKKEIHVTKLGNTPLKTKELKKDKHLEFVFLTKNEYQKLTEQYSISVIKSKIEDLNNYIGSKGKKYKSHYHTILAWLRRDGVPIERKQPSLQEVVS